MNTAPIEVSVIMPCLDEVRTVARCVETARTTLHRMGVVGEVIVADNGSRDGSPDAAREAGARVVLAESRGYGHALQAGIASANGAFIVMGDADDSYDFGEMPALVERLAGGDDLVLGNRFRGGIRPGAMPWLHRYVGNPLLTGLLNWLFWTRVGDAHCGLRAFRAEAYRRWSPTSGGMEFASELVVRAALAGSRIGEVPVTLRPDGRGRPPHLRSFRDGWRHLCLMLRLRFSKGA